MKKVIIDRKTWHRGGNNEIMGRVRLLNHKEYKCCLGFAAQQLGSLTDEEICGVSTLDDLDNKLKAKIADLYVTGGDFGQGWSKPFAATAMRVNDARFMSDEDREAQLVELFREGNIELVFTN